MSINTAAKSGSKEIAQENTREASRDKIWDCFNDIDGRIYFAERLLQSFQEQFFGTSEEAFQASKDAQNKFVWSHEFMCAQIWAISNILFDIRLKCEFADGLRESSIVKAHIEIEDHMRDWLKKMD